MVLSTSGGVFRYTVWLRIVQASKKNRLFYPFVYLIFRHYTYKYGVHIDSNIPIGRGLLIVHGDGVYLNCHSVGENFTIYQNVTVGTDGKEEPTIKNNVVLYTGSLCIGGIILEDNVTVGGNAFLNKDTEPNGVYVGIPAKNIKSNDF